MIGAIQDPPFEAEAALYFMAGGHYLFRRADNGNYQSKFVTALDVAAAFSQHEVDSGWMPAGVVRCGHCAKGAWFVYSAPAQRVSVFLQGEPYDQQIEIPIPRTVLLGVGESYYLWALKTSHFDPMEEAFRAPFPNIYGNTEKICWGTNRPGEADPGKAREVWDLFFRTPFNGDIADHKSVKASGDVRYMLDALAERKAKKYPADDLVSMRWSTASHVTRQLEV